MSVRIVFFIMLLFFLKISYAEDSIIKPVENIDPPLYGIVIKGDNVIINIEIDDLFSKKNLASYIKPQSLVLITSTHKNLPYFFIETETVKGWFNQNHIQIISQEDFDKIFNLEKVLLTKQIVINNVIYPPATKLPVLSSDNNKYIVLIATNDDFEKIKINKKFTTKPLKPNVSNLKMVTKIFNKKPYVWANNEKGWDCSGLIQDMYSFIGITIPRNSYDQINYSDSMDVSEYSMKEKEKILNKSKPYYTLLYFPGHIMLYTGKKGKDYFSFQALNRIDDKKFGYIGFFPLKKTGLLKKVTKIGFINPDNINKQYSLLNNSKEGI